ncbi:MAG: TonB-dependent receptor [Elusimicrobiota bacterium]
MPRRLSPIFLVIVASAAAFAAEPAALEPVVILGTRIESNPAGRAIGRVERSAIEKTDAFSLRDLMHSLPGVAVKQSNGPRDFGISLRGSGAKTGFGVRNIKIYEDWFPMTQSDGLSRTDVNDPNSYEGIDVIRGPSSALYDNYSLGGVVNFRTRRGRDIQGFDAAVSAGSFGYQNEYVHFGRQTKSFEYAAFGSLIRGDGHLTHSGFTTVTEDLTMTFSPDEQRSIVVKFLNNDLKAQVPSRLSQADFDRDSRSAGATAITGGATVSAQQAAQTREDRRTILGARYEYAPAPDTGYRLLGAYDVKDINQTFGTIGDNHNPNFHHYADVTRETEAFGRPVKYYAGFFFNHMEQEAESFRNLADGEGTRGALQSNTRGTHQNIGARLREELELAPDWTAIAGLGVERSKVKAAVQTRTAVAEVYSRTSVDRSFFNGAPEASLVYHPSPDFKTHARAAMGYGVPGISQLTTTPAGLSGNNTGLKPQRNLGFELGAAGKAGGVFSYDAAVYYEFFYNEFVTQSPGAGLSNFTSNAPRAEHRGVELWAKWRLPADLFLDGAYTFNDHVYKDFNETIGAGTTLQRAGRKIPGVETRLVDARLGFDAKGLPGGWVEASHVASFYINNSNTLRTRPYTVFNANLNWARDVAWGPVKRYSLSFDVKNVFDLTYQASAVTVTDLPADTATTLVTSKQAFFAGAGRGFYAGVKLHF